MTMKGAAAEPLCSGNKRTARSRARRRGKDGLFTVDFASPTIEADLTHVFRQNVAKARRENKRILGSADGVKLAR